MRPPSAAAKPARCSRATAASTSWCACRRALRGDLEAHQAPADRAAGERRRRTRAHQLHPARRSGHAANLRPGPNQVSREDGKRRVVVSANVRGRDLGSLRRRGASRRSPAGEGARRLLDHLGRHSSSTCSRPAKRLQIVVPLALLLVFALLFAMFGNVKDGLLVFTGIPFALTGGIAGAVAARHSAVDLGGGRLHRAVGRGGAQRPGDDLLHPQPARRGHAARRRPSAKAR